MKITRVTYKRLDLELSEPYKIAYETITKTVNFILIIETDTPFSGYGCAAPDQVVTGETPEMVDKAITDIIIPFLTGMAPNTYAHIIYELKKQLQKQSSSMALVDMALYDLLSRKAGIPLYQYLGGFRHSIPTSITIGIQTVIDTLRQASDFIQQGFSILKIKGGSDLDDDIEKMIRLRENFPNVTLRFDGNQGYTVDESLLFMKQTADVGIELLEQPVKSAQASEIGQVTSLANVPVMADESLKTLDDAFLLARNQHIHLVNIKLMKVGGITEAKHINSVAKSAGIEVMVGCIDECALGISAGLHFALSRPNIRYADLDGHLNMLNDPFQNLFRIENGIMIPGNAAGLGMIDESVI